MAAKKHSSLDRVLGRLDALDAASLAGLVQKLARERRLLEAIFNTLREGILVIDAEGRIDYANDAAAQLIGFREGEGATLWRLVPGLRQTLSPDPEAELAGGERADRPAVAREIEITYPQPRFVRLYMVPFQAPHDAAEDKFAVILTDITREKKSTREQIESERTSSILLLAAGVAHELGNPLNSLTIHLQLAERRLKKLRSERGAEAVAESVRVCQEEVRRLDGIIRNFLEAIRPRPPDLGDVDIVDVLNEVLRFQSAELKNRGIVVEGEALTALPLIAADRNQLKQVFFNLIKNAAEAMQPGGRLRITSRADDSSVYLQFADTGSGIRREDLSKVFEPYHTTKSGGSGLGLMIVQRILREHGGQIGIESAVGSGTVVTLQFPQKNRRVRMLGAGESG